jgi:hypothetical protein
MPGGAPRACRPIWPTAHEHALNESIESCREPGAGRRARRSKAVGATAEACLAPHFTTAGPCRPSVQRMADLAQVVILISRNTKMNHQTTSPLADVAGAKRRNRHLGKRSGSEEGPNRAVGLAGYSLASCTDAGREITPPEICDAIRNATTMAGTLISLRNWSTESIVVVPQGNFKSQSAKATAKREFNPPFAWSADRLSEAGRCRPPRKS